MKAKRVHFRIYPDTAKSCYYNVFIFKTEEEMYAHFKRTNIQPEMDIGRIDFRAICQSWTRYTCEVGKKRIRHPEIGQILFHSAELGAGVVSHEFTHATTYWAGRRTKLRFADLYDDRDADERYAWALGHMVNQFWVKYWKKTKEVRWLKIR